MQNSDAFEQLNHKDQKSAIDLAVATIVVGLRIPSTGKPLYDWMATEFASTYSIPPNVAKYALRSLGRRLMDQNWELTITKNGDGVTTSFTPEDREDDHETIIR